MSNVAVQNASPAPKSRVGDALVLLFTLFYPTILTFLYFVYGKGLEPGVSKLCYVVGKSIQFAFPVLYTAFAADQWTGLAVMPAIVLAFFSYWIFVRRELMAVDIVIYIAAMAGAVLLARRLSHSHFVRKWWPLWAVLAVLVLLLAGYLTYHAPDWLIFADLG